MSSASDANREHQRRKALELLLFQLTALDVGHVILESRGLSDDKRDRDLLRYMAARQDLLGPIRMDHTIGRDDPMLWIPDAVCGIISAHRCGTHDYFDQLRSCIDVLEI